MSVSVTLKSYFYEVLIPSSQKNTSSPIEDILHHVSISFMKKLALYKCFNPRTHTGCDYRNAIENGASEVSIHAPTRGATIFDLRKFISVQTFQSTHPHGVRLRRNHPRTISTKFQSTHPHGVRRYRFRSNASCTRFNPRTHTGCDSPKGIGKVYDKCFNPRTHTGCDSNVV